MQLSIIKYICSVKYILFIVFNSLINKENSEKCYLPKFYLSEKLKSSKEERYSCTSCFHYDKIFIRFILPSTHGILNYIHDSGKNKNERQIEIPTDSFFSLSILIIEFQYPFLSNPFAESIGRLIFLSLLLVARFTAGTKLAIGRILMGIGCYACHCHRPPPFPSSPSIGANEMSEEGRARLLLSFRSGAEAESVSSIRFFL